MSVEKENANKVPVFQLKASLYTLTTLHLLENDLAALHEQLTKLRTQAPKFLNNAPIIIDLQRLKQDENTLMLDFTHLKQLLQQHALSIVGLRHLQDEAHQEAAKVAGFNLLPNATGAKVSGAHSTELGSAKPLQAKDIKKGSELTKTMSVTHDAAPAPVTSAAQSTLLITKPVRSGQQIYAKDADLIVTSMVSPGAEIMADGNIHVYGALKGRALAGASGNTNARIFCQQLSPELVSIAGNYWLNEDVTARLKGQGLVQIFLKNDQLCVEPLA